MGGDDGDGFSVDMVAAYSRRYLLRKTRLTPAIALSCAHHYRDRRSTRGAGLRGVK